MEKKKPAKGNKKAKAGKPDFNKVFKVPDGADFNTILKGIASLKPGK